MTVYIEGKPAEYWLRRMKMKSFDSHISFFSWDFVFAEGDSLLEKYQNLYETIDSIVSITRADNDESYIIGKNELISAITTVIGYGEKINFQPRYEEMGEVLYCGYIKTENSKKPGFDIYEDKNAPEDKILIHTNNKISILNIFNYPIK